jgi:hypothetical protein
MRRAVSPRRLELELHLPCRIHLDAPGTALASIVPRRLAQAGLEDASAGGPPPERRLAELGNKTLAALAARFHDWRVQPAGTEGWRKAEVSAGGVATNELDPRTFEARRAPGRHFVGEVVDVVARRPQLTVGVGERPHGRAGAGRGASGLTRTPHRPCRRPAAQKT